MWLTEPDHKLDAPPKQATVSGFPALQLTVPRDAPLPDKCNIIVDVHARQYIDVFSNKLDGGNVTGSRPFCREATKVAAMVLKNADGR